MAAAFSKTEAGNPSASPKQFDGMPNLGSYSLKELCSAFSRTRPSAQTAAGGYWGCGGKIGSLKKGQTAHDPESGTDAWLPICLAPAALLLNAIARTKPGLPASLSSWS